MQVDLDIMVYAVIAALLLGRLWAVIGTRNENEPQRPNPLEVKRKKPEEDTEPQANRQHPPVRLAPLGPPPHSLAGGLAQVTAIDALFEEKQFLQEARDIFSSIVGAYARGKLHLVSDFLSPALMETFQKAIETRGDSDSESEPRIARIKEAEVTAARAEDKKAFVTVRFVSDQECGSDEAKKQVEEVIDIWTFARDTSVPGTKWAVVETRS